ncbi:hypothetical protein DA075_35635 (plasmid) [Methylobacterium currus]|uniref:Uncharacterized protein n=1 Tax=Methylobacterium currus TaxID=2051553 RepID=A0A2R4WXD3_9HYPH|nr:hypothetical protein [Methylobacterium currus]AWB26203.1 hypothetical protein DA075_35635 [Methylobacterium currus]
MIAPCDQFGPWRPDITDAERLARLRSLRAIAHLTLGPRGEAFAVALRLSERDPDQLPVALRALDALAPLDRRQVLASFASLHRTTA